MSNLTDEQNACLLQLASRMRECVLKRNKLTYEDEDKNMNKIDALSDAIYDLIDEIADI